MHGSRIPIWFFIGVLLLIYGLLIFGYGAYEWATGSYPAGVQLTNLHAPFWWGGLLSVFGIFYTVKFRPGRASGNAAGKPEESKRKTVTTSL